MTALSSFDEVIRDFAQAKHLPRIKKLLVYACTQRWEPDPDRLAQFNLHDLIETLMQLAPTLEQLQAYLEQVTQTLSKPAEYRLIANIIIQHLRTLYMGPPSLSRLNANPHLFWQIAQTLEHDAEHFRIRKLLVLMCRNYWESDGDRLLAINLADLIVELHQLTQSPENLSAALTSVVRTTNKPEHYRAIAQRIVRAFDLLYTDSASSITEIRSASVSSSTSPTFITEPPGLDGKTVTSSEPLAPSLAALPSADGAPMTVIEPCDLHVAEVTDGSQSGPADPLQIPKFSKAELFDLRLEIMKYTIPLLAKQLMFLTLFSPPGRLSDEEQTQVAADPDTWIALKSRDFDDLIEGILSQSPTISQLEENLHLTAQSLSNARQYGAIANAIVRSVKTLIAKHQIHHPSSAFRANSRTGSKPGLNPLHASGVPRPDGRETLTCQMFSSTISFDRAGAPFAAQISPPHSEPVGAIAPDNSPQPQVTDRKSTLGQLETELLPTAEVDPKAANQQVKNDTTRSRTETPTSIPDKATHFS